MSCRAALVAALLTLPGVPPRIVAADPPSWGFVDVSGDSGVEFVQASGDARQRFIVEVKSTGAALLDADGDGLLDLFLTAGSTVERHRGGGPGYGCRLYRNLGSLRFEDATEAAGIPEMGWACGAAAADVDGDGRTDLFISCYGRDRLLLNRGGRFEESETRFSSDGWSASAAFGDLDGDGDLDLYVTSYLAFDFAAPPEHGKGLSCLWKNRPVACGPRGLPATPDHVFENLGAGQFRDVTKAWGFAVERPQYGLGVVIANLVGDFRPDVFVANDSSPNFLFENKGGHFEEVGFFAGVAYDEDGEEQAGMGIDVVDVDGNGHLDLVVTNFEDERNNLYLNGGQGTFADRADTWGLGLPGHGTLSWGVGFRDFDNDGLLDLYVANGHVYPQADEVEQSAGHAQRDHLFLGRRVGERTRFEEVGTAHGIVSRHVSRGVAFGDLDNDGDVDLVVCHLNERPGIFENRAPAGNRSVTLILRQPGPNPRAIGARVAVAVGPVSRVTEVRRQSSFQCSSDPRIHVGLGSGAPAGTAEVRWPDGTTETFDLPANGGPQTLHRGKGKPSGG